MNNNKFGMILTFCLAALVFIGFQQKSLAG